MHFETPVIPLIIIENPDHAQPLAKTLLDAGIQAIEIALRTPAAMEAIQVIKAEVPELKLGAGTVMTARQLVQVEHLDVDFVISPGLTPRLATAAQACAIQFIPGVCTPSEVMRAQEHGLHLLKFFPAEASGGIDTLKALYHAFPNIQFCPTGGINLNNASDYLALDNVSFVAGSWIAPAELINDQNWDGIHKRAREALEQLSAKG